MTSKKQRIKFTEWFPTDLNNALFYVAVAFPVAAAIAVYLMAWLGDANTNGVTLLEYSISALWVCCLWWLCMVGLYSIFFIPYFIYATCKSKGHPIIWMKLVKENQRKEETTREQLQKYLQKQTEEFFKNNPDLEKAEDL